MYKLAVMNDGSNSVLQGPSSGSAAIGGSVISSSSGTLFIELPSPVTAFGADVQQSATGTGSISVSIPTQDYYQDLGAVPSVTFFGVTSPEPFVYIRFHPLSGGPNTSNSVSLDNVSFGNLRNPVGAQIDPVPEPVSALLVLAGVGGILWAPRLSRRTRRRNPGTLQAWYYLNNASALSR